MRLPTEKNRILAELKGYLKSTRLGLIISRFLLLLKICWEEISLIP
jgi:hypothetical protein